MKKHPHIHYAAIVAVCFLYTGSVYMSQFYRLMDHYSGIAVDAITSGYFYLLQAAGIAVFCLGMMNRPKLFRDRRVFAGLLILGTVFMAVSQLAASPALITACSCVFNLHTGICFGFYLSMFAENVRIKSAGLSFGIAYAFGSVGTYVMSLINGGDFLASREITAFYFLLAAATIALVLTVSTEELPQTEKISIRKDSAGAKQLMITVCLMTIISAVGSNLYYSLPIAKDVNWNLIRAFYACGLIAAGFIMDRSRLIGEIITIASLTYPLIATSLIGEGINGTTALGLSYLFRGFLTVYYIIAFTDMAEKDRKLSWLAPVGLLISRLTEAVLTLLLLYVNIPGIIQLIFSAVCFIPLLIIFCYTRTRKPSEQDDAVRRLADFSQKYGLTARESEVLKCLAEGLSDSEIADKCFISRNTVRFHVSNIMKKTSTTSRVEVVRLMNRL